MTNLEQVRALYEKCEAQGWKLREHKCEPSHGVQCIQPLLLGNINCWKFDGGDDPIEGLASPGEIYARWDNRLGKITEVYGIFQDFSKGTVDEDYSEILK